ncbi:MAG TPA: CocE/NonD family hydrolase [Steroidobacteraceae bacterium]|nr:CocE/NonD family hydrolase [Steroidobacteraceae bacterium]
MGFEHRISRRRFSLLAAAFGLFRLPRVRAAGDPAAPFDVLLESNVRVRMRDGVHLATDVYRPARAGKLAAGRFPAILERTPYGRNVTSFRDITAASPTPKTRAEVAAYYVRHGYIVIFQDCRGCHDSEGEFIKYLREGPDGFDTCEWIRTQPWSNGRIGTMGLSYAAHTQVALACLDPPGLEAMYIDCGGFSNAYQGGIRQGGTFELKQVTWAYNQALESREVRGNPPLRAALERVDLKAWFASMPWKRGYTPLSLVPQYESYVYEQWEHGTFDAYWKQLGIYAAGFYRQFADAAMLHLSGWYDAYARTATENYMGLSKLKRGPVKLIMGPWTHGGRSTPYAGEVAFGADSTLDAEGHADYFAQRLAWFDRYLQGEHRVRDPDPPVRLFVMGGGSGRKTAEGRLDHGGRWRSESDWPIPDRKLTAYYLTADGRLSLTRPADRVAPLSYDFDPHHPVPTMGGTVTSGEPLMRGGGYDQRERPEFYGSRPPFLPVAARPDVLVFETEPLAADVEVTGAIEALLWISSDAPDTDFTIKLVDVYPPGEDYPDGFALNVTDGILRCRYRDSWERPSPLSPGTPYAVKVEAFPTSNLFRRGHRMRLDVSSSNFPHFDVNPNTGAPEGTGLTRRTARNTVYVDAERASHVILPIIPPRGPVRSA